MLAEAGFVIMVSWSWTFDLGQKKPPVQQTSMSVLYESEQLCITDRIMNNDQLTIEWEQDLHQGHARVHKLACDRVYQFNRVENSQ